MKTEEALALLINAGEYHTIDYKGKKYWMPYVTFEINGETIPGLRKGKERAILLESIMREYKIKFKTYLDVGCNMGYFVFYFSKKFKEVDGLDFSIGYLNFARTVYKEIADRFHYNDLNKISLSSWTNGRKFEVVTALSIIEYINDKSNFVKDLYDITERLCIVEGHSEDEIKGLNIFYENLLKEQPWEVIRRPERTDAGINAPTKIGRLLWVCLK